MQQVNNFSIDNIPKNGYYVSKEEKKENFYQNETHIHKQNVLSGAKATIHRLSNDIFTYFPKGFQGSKNSDFYEYLSLGMVPYLIGSVMMYGLYKGANGFFTSPDKCSANAVANKMGAGILLYGLGKWASKKLAHTLIHASTGVNLDMLYLNKVNELPEPGQEKGLVRTQYPGVFDSVAFYRIDLLDKDSELNHDNVFWYRDKIAKKAGFKFPLNDPNMSPKIRALKARTTAMENVSKYITAALGVALGAQNSFKDLKFSKLFIGKSFKFNNLIGNLTGIYKAFIQSFPQLWKGTERNVFTKYGGKALLILSAVSTLLTWLIPTIAFKTNPNTMKSKVDTKKEFEVC